MNPNDAVALGYLEPRTLPTGEIAALHRLLFTVGLVVGIDEFQYRTRYCYTNYLEAYLALLQWNGEGDPPGFWVKQKGRDRFGNPVDRSNPLVEAETGVKGSDGR